MVKKLGTLGGRKDSPYLVIVRLLNELQLEVKSSAASKFIGMATALVREAGEIER